MERDCFGEGRILCGEKTQLGGMEDNSLRDLGGGGGLVRPNWLRWSKFRGSSQTWGCSWRVSGHCAVAQEARRREATMVSYCWL